MDNDFLEKVFITQFGAIKPPWIHRDTFYKLVFNFCDRWCERCKLSGICRVYQKEKEREKRFIKKGINPKSIKATFLAVSESFEETKELLEKEIKRLKIEITDKENKKYEEDEERKEKIIQNDEIVLFSKKLSFSLVKLAEDIYYYFLEESPKEIKEPLEILSYYMHFFSVKIQRTVFSEIEEKKMEYQDTTFDSKNSAFLSYVSVIKIINALTSIQYSKNINQKIKSKVFKLIPLFKDLDQVIDGRFQLFRWPKDS